MPRKYIDLLPRKNPVQDRSTHTVEAIFEGCVQGLLAVDATPAMVEGVKKHLTMLMRAYLNKFQT